MTLAVIPVLVGPLQVLLAVLPAILIAMGTTVVAMFKPSTFKKLLKLIWKLKVQSALIIISLVAFFWTGRWAVGKLGPKAGAIERSATDWPVTRGTLARTGAAPGTAEPNSGGIIWQHKKGNEAFFASPAVVGNRVYESVADMGAFGQSGRIYAFDADTGRIAWTGGPAGYQPTFSSPVVAGNSLLCGEGLHFAKNARIVCLALDTGAMRWEFHTQHQAECAPVVADGRVFLGAGNDGYYCVDLQTGKLLWHLDGAQYPDAETALAVYDGKVYAGLGRAGGALCVFDAATGKELHREAMPYPVFSPLTISDGKLYLGMGGGDYINHGQGGEVRCVDLATLKTDWKFPLGMTVLGSIAAKDDRLYFTSRDGFVYALTRAGKLVAKFDAHSPMSAAPAVTEKYVYAVTEAGLLLALSRDTLQPVWEFRLGSKPLFISAPTIARGHVYVGTQNDGFLCVGEPGKAVMVASDNDDSPIPDAGAFTWNFPADQQGATRDCLVTGKSVALADKLYVPTKTGILSISLGETPTSELVKEMPPVATGTMEVKSLGDSVVALDRETQRELWRTPALSKTPATLVKDRFYIGTEDHLECRSLLDGHVLWSKEAQLVTAPLVARGRLLYATKDALMLLDLETQNVTPWMDTSWLGPVCGPMTLKDSRVYAPLAGWGIVCLEGAK